MNPVTVALRFLASISNFFQPLGDELVALTAQLNAGFKQIVDQINGILGVWVDVPFNTANYTSANGGAVTAIHDNPYTYRYRVIGKTMWLSCSAQITCAINTNEIRFKIPGGYVPKGITGLSGSGDYWQRTTGSWSDNNAITTGVTGVFIGVTEAFVAVFRYDVDGEPDFPANTVTTGFMIVIPLA